MLLHMEHSKSYQSFSCYQSQFNSKRLSVSGQVFESKDETVQLHPAQKKIILIRYEVIIIRQEHQKCNTIHFASCFLLVTFQTFLSILHLSLKTKMKEFNPLIQKARRILLQILSPNQKNSKLKSQIKLNQPQRSVFKIKAIHYTSNRREIIAGGVIGQRSLLLVSYRTAIRNTVRTWLSEITREMCMESESEKRRINIDRLSLIFKVNFLCFTGRKRYSLFFRFCLWQLTDFDLDFPYTMFQASIFNFSDDLKKFLYFQNFKILGELHTIQRIKTTLAKELGDLIDSQVIQFFLIFLFRRRLYKGLKYQMLQQKQNKKSIQYEEHSSHLKYDQHKDQQTQHIIFLIQLNQKK